MESRRKFIKQLSIRTAASIPIIGNIMNTKDIYSVHVKECNFSLESISPSVIGFLYSTNPNKIEQDINKLRIKHHYRSKISFRSTDKYKFGLCKDLINYFFNEPSLHYYARVITNIRDIKHNNINYVEDVIYRLNYKKALLELQKRTHNSKIHLDFITRLPRRSNQSYEKREVPYINFKTSRHQLVKFLNDYFNRIDLKIENHDYNNMSQLCDFLTGNIWGDTTIIENAMKLNLLKHFKDKLGIKKSRNFIILKIKESSS